MGAGVSKKAKKGNEPEAAVAIPPEKSPAALAAAVAPETTPLPASVAQPKPEQAQSLDIKLAPLPAPLPVIGGTGSGDAPAPTDEAEVEDTEQWPGDDAADPAGSDNKTRKPVADPFGRNLNQGGDSLAIAVEEMHLDGPKLDADGIYDDDGDSDSDTEGLKAMKEERPVSGAMDFKKARPKTATGHDLTLLGNDQFQLMLEKYCNYIFGKADQDSDGGLDVNEFTALVQSATLGLDISDEDAAAMMSEYDQFNQGQLIEFSDFVDVMVDLMERHSKVQESKKETGAEWFVMYFDDDPNSLPLYYNTAKRAMTYDKPAGISYKVDVEDSQQFQTLAHHEDETVTYTSYVDQDGVRMFLDLDAGEWLIFPEDWIDNFVVVEDGDDYDFEGENNDDFLQDELISFSHHITGHEYEAQMENGVRMLYDEELGTWVPIPVCLEVCVPSVTRALYEISKELPGWTNVTEKVLALRAQRYNAQKTVAWKMTEMEYAGDTPDGMFDAKAVLDSEVERAEKKAAGAAGGAGVMTEEIKLELEALRASVERLGAENRAKEDQLKDLEVELTGKSSQTSTAEQLVEDLKAARAKAEADAETLRAEKKTIEEARVKESQVQLTQTVGTEVKVVQLETRVAELQEELRSVQTEGGTVEAAAAAQAEKLSAREAALEEARTQVSDLTSKVAAESARADGLNEKIVPLEVELNAAKESTLALRNDLESGTAANAVKQQEQALKLGKLKVQVESTRAQQVELATFMKEPFIRDMLSQFSVTRNTLAAKCEVAIEEANRDLVAKYRYEVRQRKLLYNQLQELKGNIRVFCRVRYDDRVKCVLAFPDEKGMGTPTEIVCPNPRDPSSKKKFEFDRVFSPASSQQNVFDDTEPIMTSAVDGYNVCILAYGQTGSGKTFTMMGTEDNPGVNRRCVKEILKVCKDRETVDYVVKVSLMEIYNEKFVDLLSDLPIERQECDLRMDPKTKAGYVTNLTERVVNTPDDVVKTLADGEVNRSVASTKMNSVSSRSHLLLTLIIEGVDTISGQKSVGKLTMVDLAGSERISKTEATGQRLVEAAAINKSLSALGQVFNGLRTGQSHISFRNSKLTHILQDSLGGDSKCCVFINVSPAESNLAETLGTINFGSGIRTIELKGDGKKKKKKKDAA